LDDDLWHLAGFMDWDDHGALHLLGLLKALAHVGLLGSVQKIAAEFVVLVVGRNNGELKRA